MKIVVPFDASLEAVKAVEAAGRYAAGQPAQVYLINIAFDPVENAAARTKQLAPAQEALATYAEKILTEAQDLLAAFPNLEISTQVILGHTADRICSFAAEKEADIIIMGSRGLTGLKRFLLGSVAHHVVLHAPCTVMVVKNKLAELAEAGS